MDVISSPVLISKEGKWFVACCPILDIATQGRTEEEVKENMVDLIQWKTLIHKNPTVFVLKYIIRQTNKSRVY